jgi:hypothetical protein
MHSNGLQGWQARIACGGTAAGRPALPSNLINSLFGYPIMNMKNNPIVIAIACIMAGSAQADSKAPSLNKPIGLIHSGAPAGISAAPPACLQDLAANLAWEIKTDDSGLRDRRWTYARRQAAGGAMIGGEAGHCGGTLPQSQCTAQAYIAAVNAQGLCGAHDWRLPSLGELLIIRANSQNPSADAAYFQAIQAIQANAYWTDTSAGTDQFFTVAFGDGANGTALAADANSILLARSGKLDPSPLAEERKAPKKPNLAVTAVTADSSASAGGELSVGATIKNTGKAGAGESWATFYLSTDKAITQSDISTTYGCSVPALLPGEATSACHGNIVVPADIAPGAYYLGAYADDEGAIAESKESDNGRSASRRTSVGGGSAGGGGGGNSGKIKDIASLAGTWQTSQGGSITIDSAGLITGLSFTADSSNVSGSCFSTAAAGPFDTFQIADDFSFSTQYDYSDGSGYYYQESITVKIAGKFTSKTSGFIGYIAAHSIVSIAGSCVSSGQGTLDLSR